MALTATQNTEAYQFFIIAFGAAPGVTNMTDLEGAYTFGMTTKQIVNVYAAKPYFLGLYPAGTSEAFAAALVSNVLANSGASAAAKAEAQADIVGALNAGMSRGDVVYQIFTNLAAKPADDAMWGSTATMLKNKVEVAKYVTEELKIDSTDAAFLTSLVSNVTNIPASVQPAKDAAAAIGAVMLTTGVDAIVGTAGNDNIIGVASALTAENTLNATDVIDGGAGTDTLRVDLKSNFTGFTGTGKMVNVENINLTNAGSIVRNFDATGVTGAQTYALNAGESSINLSNLAAAGITVNVNGQKAGDLTVGFTAKAVEGTADALALGLNAVGTAAVKDAAGVVTTATKYVTATATGIETLNVVATGDNFVNLAAAASKTIAVTGAGNLDVQTVGAITSFDASGLKGKVTADLTGAAAGTLATVKGGDGDDTLTVDLGDLTGNATVSGGAGVNTLKLSGTGTIQPTMSQFQTVELNGITADTILSGKNVSDLANVAIKGTGITGTVTLAGLNASALNLSAQGLQAGAVLLTSATNLTYSTSATAADVTAKTAKAVSTAITAAEATNATINVGAYSTQTGAITVNKAAAVTLNVASGKTADTTPLETTSFDANLTANAAQSVVVNAQGILGVTAGKTIKADAATLVSVKADQGGDMAFDTAKAQQVSITAGAKLDLQGSKFDAAEVVTIAANVGTTDATGVALAKVSTLTLSGAGAATGKESKVVLGNLGNTAAGTISNAITVNVTGLKGGAEVGTINTKGGNVTVTATEATNNVKTGAIGNLADKVGNVTINASTLGSTEIGAISTVASANVQINAAGLLGKNGTGQSLVVGDIAVNKDAAAPTTNTGSISVLASGSNKMVIGALTAKTVSVDLSGYLGGIVDGTATTGAKLGAITGQAVTVKGTALNDNAIAVTAALVAGQTSSVNVTGGLGKDVLTISNANAIAATDAATISFNGADGTADEIIFTLGADLTHANSKLTLVGVEKLTATKAVTVKAADVSGLTLTVTPAEAFTVKGTDAADTIDLSKIAGSTTATNFVINGGKGADTIKLSTDTADAQTVVVNVTSATGAYSTESSTTAYDKVSTFTAGKDKISILDTDGTAQAFTVNTTANTGATGTGVVTAVSDTKGVISFTKGNLAGDAAVALAAGSAEIDTLAEIVALVDTAFAADGKVVGFQFNGNSYLFGQNGTADVLVELTGVTAVTDFTGYVV